MKFLLYLSIFFAIISGLFFVTHFLAYQNGKVSLDIALTFPFVVFLLFSITIAKKSLLTLLVCLLYAVGIAFIFNWNDQGEATLGAFNILLLILYVTILLGNYNNLGRTEEEEE